MNCPSTRPPTLCGVLVEEEDDTEAARAYVEHYGDLWRSTSVAVPFLRWLYAHPKVLGERARIYGIKEELLWKREYEQRRTLLDLEERFLGEIDDMLSKEIVVKRFDRHNRPIDPWLYPTMQPQYRLS